MTPLLSILIPTTVSRLDHYKRLRSILDPQLNSKVEVIDCYDNFSIGSKRNKLLAQAQGKYVVSIDDDDLIAPNYVDSILKAISILYPDTVNINVLMISKRTFKPSIIKISNAHTEYSTQKENGIIYRYYPPCHLSPIRTDIARKVQYPDSSCAEDQKYALELVEKNLIKTAVDTEGILYYYLWEK